MQRLVCHELFAVYHLSEVLDKRNILCVLM
jgi:hypothetical protein